MEAIQLTDTAIDFEIGATTILKKRWVVASAETTSNNLDKVVKNKSESGASKQSDSLSSLMLLDSDMKEHIFREVLAYDQVRVENTPITSFVGPTDSFTPILDYYSRHVDAQSVKNEVERLFAQATFIDLEPGMANEFSEGLEQVIERHGTKSLDAIKRIILNEDTALSIAMEALKYIGNSDSNKWHKERRLMLEDCLRRSLSAWVRDGAGLGLSFLDDPLSIPELQKAIDRESSMALKEDLQLVLDQLQRTALEP